MEHLYTAIITSFLYILFFGINTLILISDIKHRKIKNIYLIGLILLLPIWYYFFDIGLGQSNIPKYIFVGMILLSGIFFYAKKNILGSGDIKYSAILVLYLGNSSIVHFIGNAGAITLLTLILWWIYVLWYIIKYSKSVDVDIKKELLRRDTYALKWLQLIGGFILDWIIIGFFIFIIFKDISIGIFEFIPVGREYYFLTSLSVFIIRPMIRKILTHPKYMIFGGGLLLIYFGLQIRDIGILSFVGELGSYIKNIWHFAAIILCVNIFTKKIFAVYDFVAQRVYRAKPDPITIPYSLILFISFSILYFYNFSIFSSLKILF